MLSNSDSVKYGNSCGVIYFAEGGENKYISIDSIYCTNKNGTVLELDYHSNIPFEVGVYGRSSSASAYQYVSSVRLAANEGKGWQKMYILLNKVWATRTIITYILKPLTPIKNPIHSFILTT